MVTTQQPTTSVLPNGHAPGREPFTTSSGAGLTLNYAASLLVVALVVGASAAGLTWGAGDVYGGSSSVLVSRGADVSNLLLVPLVLPTMWAARQGSLRGLLLWPGGLFYALYAYLPYVISAPATWLLFAYVALVTLSAFTLIGLLATIDGSVVRHELARAPAGWIGGALVAIGLLAYAGLAANAGSTLAEVGGRGHWVADWIVGTPVLVLGGVLLWRRAPLGYVAAAGLLLVSALGGVVFAAAAAVDNLLTGPRTEPAIIAVHLVISAVSGVLLAVFVRRVVPDKSRSDERCSAMTFRSWGQPGLWLLVGSALLPFAGYQLAIPLVAWLAPIFLLRFVRTAPSARLALPLVCVATAASILVDLRGGQAAGFDLLVGVIMMPLLRGVLYTLPYAADRALAARLGPWPRLFVFPLAWTSLDWLMSLLNATGTFGSPAYSQADLLVLVQVVSVTGMWGLTLLIVWGASSANAVWERGWRARASYRWAAPFMAVFMAVVAFGVLRLGMPVQAPQTVVAATIALDRTVMDRAGSGVDWATFNRATDAQRAAPRPQFAASINEMFAYTEAALRQGARLVGWSEGAGLVLEEDLPGTVERAAVLARQYDAYLQLSLGIPTRSPSWPFVRNVSILVDPTGAVRWVYDKTHPVVGAEALTTIRGAGLLPFADTPYGRLSTAICNDLGYPELLRQAGQGHADILFAPTHDIPPNAIPDAAEARYRAVENGFALLRPAALGYSLVTDAYGRVLAIQETSTDKTSVLVAAIPTRGVTTVYSVLGDWLAYFSVAGLLGLTGWVFVGRRRSRDVPSLQPAH